MLGTRNHEVTKLYPKKGMLSLFTNGNIPSLCFNMSEVFYTWLH